MILTQQEASVLKDSFLFQDMTAGAWFQFTKQESFAPEGRYLTKGDELKSAEGEENRLVIVISGTLTVTGMKRSRSPRYSKGSILGTTELFAKAPESIPSLTADNACHVLFITATQMKQIFSEVPSVQMNYIGYLTEELHRMRWENRLATIPASEDRLYYYLESLRSHNPSEKTVTMPLSMSELAETLHISRASLYRVMGILEEKGLVQRMGRRVTFL